MTGGGPEYEPEMPRTPDDSVTPETTENSNAIALGLIGDEWNLAIVRLAIMSGVRMLHGAARQVTGQAGDCQVEGRPGCTGGG